MCEKKGYGRNKANDTFKQEIAITLFGGALLFLFGCSCAAFVSMWRSWTLTGATTIHPILLVQLVIGSGGLTLTNLIIALRHGAKTMHVLYTRGKLQEAKEALGNE